MWFYKIETEKGLTKITWNTKMTYVKNFFGIVGVVACLLNIFWLAGVCLTVLAVSLIYYLIRYGDLVKYLHDREVRKQLDYSGSQYSFKDPLVVTISKG